jgi:hypothetical protein
MTDVNSPSKKVKKGRLMAGVARFPICILWDKFPVPRMARCDNKFGAKKLCFSGFFIHKVTFNTD